MHLNSCSWHWIHRRYAFYTSTIRHISGSEPVGPLCARLVRVAWTGSTTRPAQSLPSDCLAAPTRVHSSPASTAGLLADMFRMDTPRFSIYINIALMFGHTYNLGRQLGAHFSSCLPRLYVLVLLTRKSLTMRFWLFKSTTILTQVIHASMFELRSLTFKLLLIF